MRMVYPVWYIHFLPRLLRWDITMEALKAICYFIGAFLLLIALASVGHDGYMYYLHQNEREFVLSMTGFFIEEYAIEYGQAALDMMGKETWTKYIDPVLQIKTIFLFGIPAFALLGLGKIFAVLKDRQDNKWSRNMNIGNVSSRNQKSGKFKYNRK